MQNVQSAPGATTPEVAIPEPDLTSDEVVARAERMKATLRAAQDDSERRGCCSEEIHRQFLENGFYRILQPRRFGGYEFDLTTFWKAIINVSAGDPGVGWYLALASHHALEVGAMWPERAQRELFGADGDFRAAHRAAPTGTATPVDGGYVVSGTWDYCSGTPYATHFMGNALVSRAQGEKPVNLVMVVPMEHATVLDDWGDGSILGMQSSGSNSVRVTDAFVPEHWTVGWEALFAEGPTPGTDLHGNPMYLLMIRSIFHAGLVCPVVGAAKASLDELEEILTTKKTFFPPQVPRYTHHDHQRAFGLATALTDSAEQLVIRCGELYTEYSERWARTGQTFSTKDDMALYQMLQQAAQMAVRAVEEVFTVAGSSAAKRGQRLQRYYRDVAMYRGHIAAQYLTTATDYAKIHFGIPPSMP